jgi:hypothetical protein
MLQLLSFVLLNVLITCIGGLEPVYLKQLTSDTFNDFVQNGDGLKVVYFYRHGKGFASMLPLETGFYQLSRCHKTLSK